MNLDAQANIPSTDAVTRSAHTIKRHFVALAPRGLSKHLQLRESILTAIDQGDLRFRDQVPPEKVLGQLLNLSLGTTQKALGALANDGHLIRQHGVGTFVGQPRRALQRAWHYRFTDPATGQQLPVYAQLAARTRIAEPGPWRQALGDDSQGYVRIDRHISIDGRATCLSQLYLAGSRFAALLDMPAERLESVNLKEILEHEFGYPTLEAKGSGSVIALDDDACRAMHIPPGSWGLRVRILTRSKGLQPLAWQSILVPPTELELDLDFTHSP